MEWVLKSKQCRFYYNYYNWAANKLKGNQARLNCKSRCKRCTQKYPPRSKRKCENIFRIGVWRYLLRVEARRNSSFLKPRNKAKQNIITKEKIIIFFSRRSTESSPVSFGTHLLSKIPSCLFTVHAYHGSEAMSTIRYFSYESWMQWHCYLLMSTELVFIHYQKKEQRHCSTADSKPSRGQFRMESRRQWLCFAMKSLHRFGDWKHCSEGWGVLKKLWKSGELWRRHDPVTMELSDVFRVRKV